ncbi:virulence factor family protein [Pseudorhodoferax sp.]|uniref:virulence factor family protein n=1 Tax=Pseudorhodoferax sp. TaxID=1993553 RepID=UPI0039E2897E
MRAIDWRGLLLAAALALPLPGAQAQTGAPPLAAVQTVAHGLFDAVQVHAPSGPVRQFVLLLVQGRAPSDEEQALRRDFLARGAMVAEVPLADYQAKVRAQGAKCGYAAGDFDNLARHVQARLQLPGYFEPVVAGLGEAAAYAYGLVAQSPPQSFGALLTGGLCPRMALRPPLCALNRLALGPDDGRTVALQPADPGVPWVAAPAPGPAPACGADAARAFAGQVPQAQWAARLDDAVARLAAQPLALAPPPASLADLPLVEVPVDGTAKGQQGTRLAVLLSGDGGWAGIDKDLAAALAGHGVPVVGFDSLRYFWRARTPEGLAADLDRIVRFYAARWQRPEVLLIGYSQGADVLPFALNRLPERTRTSVRLAALLAPGEKASFEFHVTNWLGPSGDRPVLPEARRLDPQRTLCVYGTRERASLCPQLGAQHAQLLPLPGEHHFDGDYPALARRILQAVPR